MELKILNSKESRKRWDKQNRYKMVDFNPTILIITLNVSDLNTPIEWQNCCLNKTKRFYKKQYLRIYYLQEMHFKYKDIG